MLVESVPAAATAAKATGAATAIGSGVMLAGVIILVIAAIALFCILAKNDPLTAILVLLMLDS